MSIDIDSLLERVKNIDIEGIVGISKDEVGEDDQKQYIILVKLLRFSGAFQNNKEACINLVIGNTNIDAPYEEITFVAPGLERCKPGDLSLTIYMDANSQTSYGAHRWSVDNSEDQSGKVSFGYRLPIPNDLDGYPDTKTLHRIVLEIYHSLLFFEFKRYELNIENDQMLDGPGKQEKLEKLHEMHKRITGPKNPDDESV